MIVTGKQGKRRSKTTFDEVIDIVDHMKENLTPEERLLVDVLGEEEMDNQVLVKEGLFGHIYHTLPVPMEQFIDDPYFLGESCSTIYPAIRDDLIEMFERPYREIVLTGSIGVGKTYCLSIAICRVIYELSCMISPQKTFGLSSGSEMVIPLISKNLTLARQIMKSAVDDKIKESPYFMTKFSPNFKKDYTLFPHNIRVTIGSYGSDRILGANVYSSCLDECLTKKSVVIVENNGIITNEIVSNLFEMGQEDRVNCKIICLDHKTKELKSGWWKIKKSSVQSLVQIGTCLTTSVFSHEHPVLVKRGHWLVYCYAKDIVEGDYVVVKDDYATKRSKVERRSKKENIRSSKEKNFDEENKIDCNELEFVGVRKERIRVDDLPDGLHLEKVLSLKKLSPEQTYSICTEYNTFIADGLVVHNTNFPPKRKGQQIATAFGQKVKVANFDIVEKIYRGLVRRIKSRFQKAGGGFSGMVILASSAATVESFIERKLRESVDDPMVFVRDHTQWSAKPAEEFCGEFFYVLCSTSATKSRILREDEYDAISDEYLEANDAFIMDIPVEFKEDFESNMEDALRDIAGFSTEAISQFVQRPKMITVCTNTDIQHPFDREEWVAGGPGAINWDALVVEVERTLPGGFKEKAFIPRRNPSAMRWCHVDTSISGDSSGLAIGHVDRWVEVVRRDLEMNAHVDQEPYYIIDFMLRINPPPAEQIYMPDIRVMIYDFMKHGFKFIGFSSDSYQYVEMHQQISRKGIKPHIISMDTSTEPYDELKSAFYEKRIEIYYYKPFIEEFKKLEYDRINGKIDHPLAGSKDCLSGDTKISLLNGSEIKISNLVDKEFWVYSCLSNGDVVPGYARNVHLVGEKNVLRIILDNGEYFDCTDDHEIMLRDGSFLEAKYLDCGDSLMPLYRDLSSRNPRHGLDGYERIKNNSNGKMIFTHQLVAKECFGFSYGRKLEDRQVIHHDDFNKRNNSPDNLKIMGWHDHRSLHCAVGSENMKKMWDDDQYRKRMKSVVSKIGKKTGTKNITKYNKSIERIEKLKKKGIFSKNGSKVMNKLWKDPEFVKKHRKRLSGNNNHFARKDITFDKILDVADRTTSKRKMMKELKCSEKVIDRILRENELKYCDIAKEYNHHRPSGIDNCKYRRDITIDVIKKVAMSSRSVGELCEKLKCTNKVYGRVVKEHGYDLLTFKKSFFNKQEKNNHKIRNIIRLREKVDVYDLTVDKYHNFAISSGVFVHNCSDAVAGVVAGLRKAAVTMPLQGRAIKTPKLSHEHSWVSALIPADKVDIDDVKAAREGISKEDFLPILFDGD